MFPHLRVPPQPNPSYPTPPPISQQEMKGKRVSDIPFVPVSGPVLFEEVERARSREAAQRGRRVMGSTGGGAVSGSGSRAGRK